MTNKYEKRGRKVNKSQKIRLYYGIFLTVLAVVVGVAFIVAVSQVYYGGIADNPDYPFEIERIREHILLPFVLLLCFAAAVIGGIVLSIVFPITEKCKAYKNNGKILAHMKTRIPIEGNDEFDGAKRALSKRETAKICVWSVALLVFLIASIFILVYSFNITRYHANALKNDMLEFAKTILVWTLVSVAVGIAAVIVDEILTKSAINYAKIAIVNGDKNTVEPIEAPKKKSSVTATVIIGIVVGVALLAYILTPIIVKIAFNWSQTVIYIVVFALAIIIAGGLVSYKLFKNKISSKTQKICLWVARAVVGVTAITFILVGIFNGGANDVLIKAINICTECIGLG